MKNQYTERATGKPPVAHQRKMMMKKALKIIMIVSCVLQIHLASAQQAELEQLSLDIEKLAQFKQILADLKKSYEVLYNGYTTIKGISEGSFNLHQNFLDGLLAINPSLRNYSKIKDIISNQLLLLTEYRSAFSRFKSGGRFTADETSYLTSVYDNLLQQSLHNLDDLTTILTAGKLRMTDEERLTAIDHIDSDMSNKLAFLRSFNRKASLLDDKRAKQQTDIDNLKKLYAQPK